VGVWFVGIELLTRGSKTERGLLAVHDAQREILRTMGDQKISRRDWLTRDFHDEEHRDHYRAEEDRLEKVEEALRQRVNRSRRLGWLGISLITVGFLLQALGVTIA